MLGDLRRLTQTAAKGDTMEPSDKWWQIRLSNVLIGLALLGGLWVLAFGTLTQRLWLMPIGCGMVVYCYSAELFKLCRKVFRRARESRMNEKCHRVDTQPDRWWQVSLKNLLLSMALFGVSLALAKVFVQLSRNPFDAWGIVFGPFAVAAGSFTFLCAAVGGIFGRFKQGSAVGLVGIVLAIGAISPVLFVLVVGALVFIFFAASIILDWHL